MKERKNQPQTLLIHVAQEDIPEQEIDLWSGLSQTLVASQSSTNQGGSSMFSRRNPAQNWLVLTGLTLFALLAFVGLTPLDRRLPSRCSTSFVLRQTLPIPFRPPL
jgi:hypothetical protein